MTDQPTKEQVAAFEKEYNELNAALSKKHGLAISFQPQWVQSQDVAGMYYMKVIPMIVALPKEETK